MSKHRQPTWVVRWNEARTVGLVWRMVRWPHRTEPPALEGIMRRPLTEPCQACGVTVGGHPMGLVWHDDDCPVRVVENYGCGLGARL